MYTVGIEDDDNTQIFQMDSPTTDGPLPVSSNCCSGQQRTVLLHSGADEQRSTLAEFAFHLPSSCGCGQASVAMSLKRRHIGTTVQRWSLPMVHQQVTNERGQTVFSVSGSAVKLATVCCCFFPLRWTVRRNSQSETVGLIEVVEYEPCGSVSSPVVLRVLFPPDATSEERILLIGACSLLDMVGIEPGVSKWETHPWEAPVGGTGLVQLPGETQARGQPAGTARCLDDPTATRSRVDFNDSRLLPGGATSTATDGAVVHVG